MALSQRDKLILAFDDPDKLCLSEDYETMFKLAYDGLKFPWLVFTLGWTIGAVCTIIMNMLIHWPK